MTVPGLSDAQSVAFCEAHREFDPIWKGGRMTRKRAYGWLSERTGIPPER